MKVKTHVRPRQDRAQHGVRAADHGSAGPQRRCARSAIEVLELGRPHGDRVEPLSRAATDAAPDRSHPAMAVNLDACIQCNLCVRACREVQVNDVIGMAGRGHNEKIVFDFDDPMGAVDLRRLRRMRAGLPDRRADAGDAGGRQQCAHRVSRPRGAQRVPLLRRRLPAHLSHQGRQAHLCHRQERPGQREPAVREGPFRLRLCEQSAAPHPADHPQGRRGESTPTTWSIRPIRGRISAPATWEEAIERAASGLKKIRDRDGPQALAGFGSAKGSNEEAYLFQKLVRTGFGTNNVDHCTRLCHASSVAALLEGVGSAAVTATFNECKNSDVIIVIGANPTENHPVAATFFKQAAKRGAKLIVMDPRGQALKRHARQMMQFKNGTDVAMLNGMLNVIIGEKLYDQQYVQTYTEASKLAENIKPFTPEEMAPICGIAADTLRDVARSYARAKLRDHLLGHGRVAAHARHRQCALPHCAVADLRPDRPSRHRAASLARAEQRARRLRRRPDPDVLPRLPFRGGPGNPRQVEKAWGTKLDPKRGHTVVEIMEAVHADEIKGMYIMGENPAMSDPDLNHARGALAHLEHLVVQDIFLTETCSYADVILPASAWPEKDGTVTNTNRQVQMGRQALPLPGEARQDLWITQEIARRIGLAMELPARRARYSPRWRP